MDRFKAIYQKWSSSIIFQAVIWNLMALVLVLVLFEPTQKSDDYDIANILYGGINGEYSPFMLYSNIILGYTLKGLMYLFPQISWFYVFQFVGLFLAFCSITYVILMRSSCEQSKYIFLIFIIYVGYEFYIRLTFTKTAGAMIAAGFLFILYEIERNQRSCAGYLGGFFLIAFGEMLRPGVLEGVVLVFFGTFIIVCSSNKEKAYLKKVIFKFVVITLIIFIASKGLRIVNIYCFEADSLWEDYKERNSARSDLTDYGIPDYNTYREEYEAIGVSENDYKMWFVKGNRADSDILTTEKYQEIRNIYSSPEDEGIWEIIKRATKGLWSYQMSDTNTMYYFFVVCAIVLICLGERGGWIKALLINGLCVLAYYYLFYRGRLQHHIDTVIYFTGAIILLYYLKQVKPPDNRRWMRLTMLMCIMLCLFVNVFYSGITSSSYSWKDYGMVESQKKLYQKNRERLSLLSNDSEHLYVVGAYETMWIYHCFTVFQVIEKNFYHNIYRLNMNHVPITDKSLTDYGVQNLWDDMVNHEVYYCASESRKSDLDVALQYIREHYHENAYCTLVKQVNGLYIYRFNEGNLMIDMSAVIDGDDKVKHSVETSIGEDGLLHISGYAYVDGADSFAQNIYIEVENHKKEDRNLYYTLQQENENLKQNDKYGGRYSSFSAELDPKEVDGCDLYLMVEIGEEIYRVPI